MTAEVQVLDGFMYPVWRLQLYLCQLRENDADKPTQHWGLVASLPGAAGLQGHPVPVYFSFLLAVALIHLQALNTFPAAHMG